MIIKKIAVFKPINARHNNAFRTGQFEIFKSINESKEYEVTVFFQSLLINLNLYERHWII